MNWADFVIAGVLTFSALISLWRGFVREAMSLVIWILAFFIALAFYSKFSPLLNSIIQTPSLRDISAFGLLFLATLLLGALFNYLLSALVKVTGLSGTDKLIGLFFGLARGLVIVMALLLLVPMAIPVNQDAWWQQSMLIPYFLQYEDWSRSLASTVINLFH